MNIKSLSKKLILSIALISGAITVTLECAAPKSATKSQDAAIKSAKKYLTYLRKGKTENGPFSAQQLQQAMINAEGLDSWINPDTNLEASLNNLTAQDAQIIFATAKAVYYQIKKMQEQADEVSVANPSDSGTVLTHSAATRSSLHSAYNNLGHMGAAAATSPARYVSQLKSTPAAAPKRASYSAAKPVHPFVARKMQQQTQNQNSVKPTASQTAAAAATKATSPRRGMHCMRGRGHHHGHRGGHHIRSHSAGPRMQAAVAMNALQNAAAQNMHRAFSPQGRPHHHGHGHHRGGHHGHGHHHHGHHHHGHGHWHGAKMAFWFKKQC